MSAKPSSADTGEWIYIEVDRKPVIRVQMMNLSTCAELRNSFRQELDILIDTCFLDNEGYRVRKQDEQILSVHEVISDNRIVHLAHIESKSVHEIRHVTPDIRKNGRKSFENSFAWIIIELISVLKWLWYICIKPIFIVAFVTYVFYHGYVKLICGYASFLPIITMHCPVDDLNTIHVPPVSELAEKSASLADILMNTDVNAPMRLIQGKSSLVEMRSRIIYSDIDATVRLKLGEEMGELQQLVQRSADHLTDMLTSFGGTLDKLQIYTQYLLEDVSKIINDGMRTKENQLVHMQSHTETEIQGILTKSFNEYLVSVSTQTDKILEKAQQAYTSLLLIQNKLDTIQELGYKGQYISEKRVDELEKSSFWSRLFDEGELGIVKHKRNLQILNGLGNSINVVSNSVGDIIMKLKHFRADAEDLKTTGVLLERLPQISIKRHKQLLNAALKRLIHSKEKLSGKLRQVETHNDI